MGDDIQLVGIEVIHDGLVQMDFWNKTKDQKYRVFVEPMVLFSKLGRAMQANHDKCVDAWTKTAPTT